MGHDRRPCPLDNSRLVSMGASFGEKGVDLSIWYCPRCDVAFVLLSTARSATALSMLQWHRGNGQLQLQDEDRGRWEALPRQFREAWESNVHFHVKGFLSSRFSEAVCCGMDGGRIPVVHGDVDGAGTPWQFAWCSFCRMGFLYTRDVFYGWELHADVSWDSRLRQYVMSGQHATGGNHAVNPQILEELPLVPNRTW